MAIELDICQRCRGSGSTIEIKGAFGEYLTVGYAGREVSGMGMLELLGIGTERALYFRYCLHCGQIEGKFPLNESKLTESFNQI